VKESSRTPVEEAVETSTVNADDTRRGVRPADARRPVDERRPDIADTLSDPGRERRLLRDARRGDHAAFVALIRRHEPRLRALAFRVLRDPDQVADALQETALRAFRSLHTFRDQAALSTWLFRVTYNVCLDTLARGERQAEIAEQFRWDADGYAPDPSARVAAGDQLSRALDELSPEHRAVVYLCMQQDLDLATAADALGIPYGTVGSRLNHARTVLRRALSGEEGR
jgi:RNA polymerase sigma-70 factor, ECF subfamily